MSTLIENVAKVTAAHAALKDAIASKGVAVPDGTKLTDMPALVGQISTEPVPNYPRASFASDSSASITVPKMLVVDITKIEDLSSAFSACGHLSSITLPDGFGSVASVMNWCFSRCRKLQTVAFPEGCGKKVWTLNYCFEYCDSLIEISFPAGFGASVQNMYSTFNMCSKIKSIVFPDGFGKKLSNIYGGFEHCSALESISFPAGFGSMCSTFSRCFAGCSSLTTINGGIEAKVSLDLSPCTKLTHDSLMTIINSIQTVTTTQTLTLGTANLAKLTDEEKKVATDKGWTLA